jgi:hypothetical protein
VNLTKSPRVTNVTAASSRLYPPNVYTIGPHATRKYKQENK